MGKIAIFDSGLGSLSIIRPIQKKVRPEIVYFADQESYPYGTKSPARLKKITDLTIQKLESKFKPDLIVVASNTPSLLLDPEKKSKIIGVYPPLEEAARKSKAKKIAVLATRSVVRSRKLQNYIKGHAPPSVKVVKIDASPLVDLVESGRFITEKKSSKQTIRKVLEPIRKHGVDVATLSSTHLPFLLPMLKEVFPQVKFLDPADSVADRVSKVLKKSRGKSRLAIYASGDTGAFQKKLQKIGIRRRVRSL
ncbi:MAG TPA: aspartate/glutamate racemase family protein [Candidatus Nitrosotalea sp.]|nr:aspartate/glutamate racemase family protein [Candidatus Nitrosotalea sp.]